MTVERVVELLKGQEAFLACVRYGYIEILADGFGQCLVFENDQMLCRFANSKGDYARQILVKGAGPRKTIFVETGEYDAILFYEGSFSLHGFWRREDTKIEARPIDLEKFKAELLEHFSTAKKLKLSS